MLIPSEHRFRALLSGLQAVLIFASLCVHAQTYKVLYTFTGVSGGYDPTGGVVLGVGPNPKSLFGATMNGGTDFGGTVFRLDPDGTKTILYNFANQGGATPIGRLTPSLDAEMFYEATISSPSNLGGIVSVDKKGNEKNLYFFKGGSDGYTPSAGLVRDSAGNLYGTTEFGGDVACNFGSGCGTIFKFDVNGVHTVLYRFHGGQDGEDPEAALVLDSAGNLYGTTREGGVPCQYSTLGCGTIFKLDPQGNETILHDFSADDGFNPSGLIRDKAGNLYGTADEGGTTQCGTVFELDSSGNFSVLHTFTGPDGLAPLAPLIRDEVGNLFGTTSLGGANSRGTVFRIDPKGNETVLHDFDFTDGGDSTSGLTADSAGNLYGVAGGGAYGYGVVFEIVR